MTLWLKKAANANLDIITQEIAHCRRSKDNLQARLDHVEESTNKQNISIASHDLQLSELLEHRDLSTTERRRDRELYSGSISELKQQVSDLQSSVAERLLMQDRHFTDQTADMIANHDGKTLRLFEKIESKMEATERATSEERRLSHDKIDRLGKQQMKFLGGIMVIAFIITLFSFDNLGFHEPSHKQIIAENTTRSNRDMAYIKALLTDLVNKKD